jgi:hypothetical protein
VNQALSGHGSPLKKSTNVVWPESRNLDKTNFLLFVSFTDTCKNLSRVEGEKVIGKESLGIPIQNKI